MPTLRVDTVDTRKSVSVLYLPKGVNGINCLAYKDVS